MLNTIIKRQLSYVVSWVDFLLWPELPESLNATFYCKEKDCLVFFWPFSLLLLETRTCLHRHSVSLASRLDQEMRRWLILHETRFTRLRFFTFHFIDVDTLYLFLNWFSMRVSDDQKYVCGHRLQCIHLYKYKKIQGSRFQRNYIIARDQKVIYMARYFNHHRKYTAFSSQDPWKFTTRDHSSFAN